MSIRPESPPSGGLFHGVPNICPNSQRAPPVGSSGVRLTRLSVAVERRI
jgi:hypothetical protein